MIGARMRSNQSEILTSTANWGTIGNFLRPHLEGLGAFLSFPLSFSHSFSLSFSSFRRYIDKVICIRILLPTLTLFLPSCVSCWYCGEGS